MDILDRLEKWLKKDQIIARNWDENGYSIDGDIEDAIEEIKRLRQLIRRSGGRLKADDILPKTRGEILRGYKDHQCQHHR